jgi:hypothetical protein
MALREIRDAHGVLWTIYDVRPTGSRRSAASVQSRLVDGWLCFQSDAQKRRLAGIPADWHTLTDHALLVMMGTARPVVGAFATGLRPKTQRGPGQET